MKSNSKIRSGKARVHTIKDTRNLKKNPKELNAWIKSLEGLERPSGNIKYSKPMPSVEELMQAWPGDVDAVFKKVYSPIWDLPSRI